MGPLDEVRQGQDGVYCSARQNMSIEDEKRNTGGTNDGPVSHTLQAIQLGEEQAIRRVWDRYFSRLIRLAGSRLASERTGEFDEEDVAVSVMESFFRAAKKGRFPYLKDDDGIWRLLSTMARRKVVDIVRRNRRQRIVGESNVVGQDYEGGHFAWLDGPVHPPEIAAMFVDEVEHLVGLLPSKYHPVALAKLECLTLAEISARTGKHLSTVERHLRIIRKRWQTQLDTDVS